MSLADPNLARKRSQAITAIASVADCVEEGFAVYYGSIMPTLKQMLVSCNTKVCSCVCVCLCVWMCVHQCAGLRRRTCPCPTVPLKQLSPSWWAGISAHLFMVLQTCPCPTVPLKQMLSSIARRSRQPGVSGFRPNRLG